MTSHYYRYLKAGDVATKSALDDREPLSVVKASNQTVNNTTVKVSDNHLTLAVAANATYHVSMMVIVSGPTGADWSMLWAFPTGATGTRFTHGPELPVTTVRATAIQARSAPLGTATAYGTDGTENSAIREELWLTTSGTAGNLTLTWAQNAAVAGTTTVYLGSYLMAYRVV
jgi:hypothetical protein